MRVGKVKLYNIDMREKMLDVAGQEIMTADKVSLRMNAVVSYRVADARKSVAMTGAAVRRSTPRQPKPVCRQHACNAPPASSSNRSCFITDPTAIASWVLHPTRQVQISRAIELDPDLAEAHAARGLSYLVSEEFPAAEREFEKALELNPRLFEAHYYFARTRFHQGRLDEAMELFRSAAEVDPQDYQSRCLRIQILRGTGHIDEARAEAQQALEVLERHLKLNPDDARAHHLGAGTLIVLGEIDRAKRWLHRAIEIDPDDPIVQYNVACNLATLGEIDDAIKYLAGVIEGGTISAAWICNDEDLANLRGDPRFEQLLQTLRSRKS